ncbi:MAG: Peptidase, partial [Parcubacteria group bacterium GW2011_GWC2_38_7]
NPMAHLSLLGSVFLLVVGFGWGKPVPFNPYNLKYKRFGSAIVALAGPASNLILAILFTIGLKVISTYNLLLPENLLVVFLYYSIILNVNLMLFNLLPLAPLDGSKVLFAIITDYKYAKIRQFLETQGPLVLIGLIFIDNFIGINIFGSVFSAVQNFINNIVF